MSTSSPPPRKEIHSIGKESFPSSVWGRPSIAPWPECLRLIRGTTSDVTITFQEHSLFLTNNVLLVQVNGLPNSWLLPNETDGSFSPQLREIIGWITSQYSWPTGSMQIELHSNENMLYITLTQNFQKWIVTSALIDLSD